MNKTLRLLSFALVAAGLSITGARAQVTIPASNISSASSAVWATKVTDETGSGLLVFNNTPTLITPNIGAATGISAALTNTANSDTFTVNSTHASFASSGVLLSSTRAASNAFYHIAANSNGVNIFRLFGNGDVTAAGNLTVSGTAGITSAKGFVSTDNPTSGISMHLTDETSPSLRFSKSNATARSFQLTVNDNFTVENVTAGTTPLVISGATGTVTANANVTATSPTTGTLVVTGGIGASGAFFNSGTLNSAAPGSQGTISNVNGVYMNWDSTAANGGYHILKNSAANYGLFGSAKQLLGSLAATDFGFDAVAGNLYLLTAGAVRVSVTANTTAFSNAIVHAVQALTGSGAVNVTTGITNANSTGGGAWTLADGVNGQTKTIVMTVDGGDGTLTPTTKTGFSTITFDAVGDSVDLVFFTTLGWMVRSNYNATVNP